ncbi:hypothetical protein BU14_0415s0017 [Porphyra umbilicalis]|uniref:Probable ATP-dependent transporter ycf16 n=1 Tax=Porphyra umbilicalis TaxID=2786 RepID=A0A1X6NVR5_PORUM|nr:hypothetical protein BU14_0415s0017 [Porphyra umbilicalis]|eukprot:OSX72672.1 hypothetical protein BU14_0415s0017 [Porphyra umbilicalis]
MLGVASVLVTATATTVLALAAVRASRVIHRRLLLSVLKAPMSWFDRTPLGRIINRFVADLDKVDSTLSSSLQSVMRLVLGLTGTIALVLYTVPAFVVPLAAISTLFFIVQEYYRPCGLDLRRLESVSRSPLISHFTESVDGATTIRAYNGQARARATSAEAMDEVNRFVFLGASANRWLATRLDLLSTLLTFSAVTLVVVFRGTIAPSLAGLMLSYLLGLSSSITWVVRQVTDTESQMSSLERIEEYSSDAVPHEDNEVGQTADDPVGFTPVTPIATPVRVRTGWPRTGRVEFENVTMRYRPDLPPVLNGVSFVAAPGERIGIVGRTGAGKSSLVAALFRLTELDSGRILVDGVDVAQLPLSTLRSRLSILPQEAFIFSSTVRGNLDPLDEATDAQVWAAIESAGLKGWVKSLATPVIENGVSAGQRQLLCLGRVLLRDSSVLVLDEATASVDAATDTAVGNTIATKLHATTLTIAHRLRSVIDSDKILVLDRGRVVEFAHPADLLADPASALSSLVDETGPATAEVLRGVARDAAAAARGGDGNGDDAVTPVKSPPSLAAAAATLTPCRGRKGSGGAHGAAVGASPARIVLDAYATLRAAIMTADSEPTAEALRHLGVPPRAWQGRLRTLVDRLAVLAAEHCGASGEVSGVGLVGGGSARASGTATCRRRSVRCRRS